MAFVQVTVEPGGTTTVVLDGGEPPPIDRQPVKPNRTINKKTLNAWRSPLAAGVANHLGRVAGKSRVMAEG